MQNTHHLQSPDKSADILIDKGELISYVKDGEELIHQKGAPGWRNADTEMFPIIGPTEANGFKVATERGEAVQDQHGLLRELDYAVIKESDHEIIFLKTYSKNSKVKNSKFPVKSKEEWLFWPYNFKFKKHFKLSNESLTIIFEIDGEEGMPFMLGYHPAFKLSGGNTEQIQTEGKAIRLQDVLDVGSIAYPVLKSNEISLIKGKASSITLKTVGFDNFMLWTEVANMLCIEPITSYPYNGKSILGKELFTFCKGIECFEVQIIPH